MPPVPHFVYGPVKIRETVICTACAITDDTRAREVMMPDHVTVLTLFPVTASSVSTEEFASLRTTRRGLSASVSTPALDLRASGNVTG